MQWAWEKMLQSGWLQSIGRSMSGRSQGYQWIVAYDVLMTIKQRPLHDDDGINKEMSDDVGYPSLLRFIEDGLGGPLLYM